jgi:integrase
VLADCRHTFASLLIAQGLDIVFISRQLGHANPATTLRIYAHLFDRVNHEARMRETLVGNLRRAPADGARGALGAGR